MLKELWVGPNEYPMYNVRVGSAHFLASRMYRVGPSESSFAQIWVVWESLGGVMSAWEEPGRALEVWRSLV